MFHMQVVDTFLMPSYQFSPVSWSCVSFKRNGNCSFRMVCVM